MAVLGCRGSTDNVQTTGRRGSGTIEVRDLTSTRLGDKAHSTNSRFVVARAFQATSSDNETANV